MSAEGAVQAPSIVAPAAASGDDAPPPRRDGRVRAWMVALWSMNPATIFVLSLLCGLIVSSIVIVASTAQLRDAWSGLFSHPGSTLATTFTFLGHAYGALLRGAVADPTSFRAAFEHPTSAAWSHAFLPIANTIVSAVPLVIAGLGLSVAFRSGAFNIGGQSQLILGATAASWVGFSFAGMPALLHVLLALVAAAFAGAVAGLIPGALKAYTGASEVIVTIMLNYIAADFLTYMLSSTFFRIGGQGDNPVGRLTLPSATLGRIFGSSLPVNVGLIVAVVVFLYVALLLNRSRLGFEFQIAGLSRSAARVAGVGRQRVYLGAFCVSGAIVGLAGAVQVLGVSRQLQTGFGSDIGYLAILVAFVGNNRPVGVVFAGLLYGALQTGGLTMQFTSGISYQLTTVIQALIVLFVTAPALIAGIFRLRQANSPSVRRRRPRVPRRAVS